MHASTIERCIHFLDPWLTAQYHLLNAVHTRILESVGRFFVDRHPHTLDSYFCLALCSADFSCVGAFLIFGLADNSRALDSGQCQVTKFISRIKSFLTNARIDMAFSPPGSNNKPIKIPGAVTRCEVRTKKCPLFTCSTGGTWTLSKSLKLIFKPLSLFCQGDCWLWAKKQKTKPKWQLQNSIQHHMMKRILMVLDLRVPYQDTLWW